MQDFCAERATWLAEQGVSYVLVGHLADGSYGLPSLPSHHDLMSYARTCPLPAVFASNELFGAFPADLGATAARDLAALDVRILFYVRPYPDWVRSSYSYDAWIGANGCDFDVYLRHLQDQVSIWPTLRIWGEAVGWHRMHVRSTDARDLTGSDLLGDCLAAMGVPLPADHRAQRSNAAPHWMVTELLRLAVGADKQPGRRRPEGMAIAEALRDAAAQAIAECGEERNIVTYTTQAQHEALRQLYNDDLARIHEATGSRLSPDESRQIEERRFLPSAEQVPAAIVSRIAELACGPERARKHPELAAFVRAPAFAQLLARPHAGVLVPGMIDGQPAAAEAHRLAGRGDLAGAIAVGARAAQADADMDLLAALARWRHDAFIAKLHPPGPPIWPPVLPDPFPGAEGIPAIDARNLTAEILGGAILHHGSLHVRGLISSAMAETLRDGIDRALTAQMRAELHQAVQDPGWFSPMNVPTRNWPHGENAMYTADSPPMLQTLIDTLCQSGIVDHIAGFMGERPALSVRKSTLRRQAAVPVSGWHQDGAFLGKQVRSVNVWLALSDCGTAAPSMDVIARRLPYVVQTNSHGALFDWSVGEGMVDILAEGGAAVLTPEFSAGDALLFDHLMLHRTSLKPGASGTRWASESWFFAPTDYPYDRLPLMV